MENSQLLEYIGETKTRNLKDEIQKEYHELVRKQFPDKANFVRSNSLISVTDVNETEIKSIGMSCIDDLFLNNWLTIMSFLLGGQGGFIAMPQSGGIGINTRIANSLGNKINNYTAGDVGYGVRLGSGSAPPAMNNFNVEIGLTSGVPENGTVRSGDSVYSVGLSKITMPTLISPTFGAGTITESVLFGLWSKASPASINAYPVARDLISPSVNYVATQSIDVEYTILI